jgi:hypothetical protein
MTAERLAIRAEGLPPYRWANLLLIAEVHCEAGSRKHPLTLDRIAIYDFFSAHPFLVFGTETAIGRSLVRAGLEPRSLTYASAPDRLANRRQRVQADVSDLIARRLIDMEALNGRLAIRLPGPGKKIASELHSFHANAIRRSASHVIAKLDKLADRTLQSQARDWTQHNALMIDVLEAV